MKHTILAAMTALGLAGCTESETQAEQVPEGAILEPDAREPAMAGGGLVPDAAAGPDAVEVTAAGANPRFDPSCLITEDSVAGIAMPDTLGQFVSAFPADTVLSFYPTYMVDFGKLCLRANSADALCANFESYDVEDYDPDIAVVGLSVYAPQCRTAEGIGPGSAVRETVEAYGIPTFAFNYDNEGREYVDFADQPTNLTFRAESEKAADDLTSPGVPNGPYAGDYRETEGDGSYFETPNYYPDGVIVEVFIMPAFEPIE